MCRTRIVVVRLSHNYAICYMLVYLEWLEHVKQILAARLLRLSVFVLLMGFN